MQIYLSWYEHRLHLVSGLSTDNSEEVLVFIRHRRTLPVMVCFYVISGLQVSMFLCPREVTACHQPELSGHRPPCWNPLLARHSVTSLCTTSSSRWLLRLPLHLKNLHKVVVIGPIWIEGLELVCISLGLTSLKVAKQEEQYLFWAFK